MRVEGLTDAWGVVVAWVGVLTGAAWLLAHLVVTGELYLHPVAIVIAGVGTSAAAAVATYWANIERFGRDEGFTAEWYRPLKELSIFWNFAYYRALFSVALPSTLVEALREAGPKVGTFLLVLSVPAGLFLGAGKEVLASPPPPAGAAASEILATLGTDPGSLDVAQYCTAQKADTFGSDPMLRTLAVIELGLGPIQPRNVQVGGIEYAREKGADVARAEVVDPADPSYAEALTLKLVDGRWLACGDLVEQRP